MSGPRLSTETSTPPTKALEPLRSRLRRAQFIAGLGFFSAVVGSILSGSLAMRILPRLGGWSLLPALLVEAAVQRLWVLVALPIVCYAAARIVELRPATAAIGAALTGELFHGLLDYVSLGWAGLFRDPGRFLLRLATLALGMLLAMRAVKAARGAALRAEERARQRAAQNRSEYEAFSAEAERLASRGEGPRSAGDGADGGVPFGGPVAAEANHAGNASRGAALRDPSAAPVHARTAPRGPQASPRLPADTFALDGSLRDLYVQDTSLEDWRRVLDHVLSGAYDAVLFRDGQPMAPPPDVVTLFDEDGVLLRFRCGHAVLQCHFFDPGEIEFDLDPRTVSSDADEAALIRFMTTVAELTGRPVDLTPENAPEAPYARCVQGLPLQVYSPKTR